ncbi:hypothetical protein QBC32DRAFT_370049 [Pseudoneurospora amorphoporcata]|uniref:Uncharacterized protein n=1 Tax=Pseudoneurospora amorphoporcata TaxID=241081 RepID=A0AAN6NXE1_9PEZI|nr:hypothetical protein QBC32DRAFT_370049 [Pseudoneurospora amorphoporcata]
MPVLIHNPKTLSLLGILHFAASWLELLHHLFWRWRWKHGYRNRGSLLDRVYMPCLGQGKAAPWLTPFIRSLHLFTNPPLAS